MCCEVSQFHWVCDNPESWTYEQILLENSTSHFGPTTEADRNQKYSSCRFKNQKKYNCSQKKKHTTKRQKHILCSIQTSLTKQLKVKVHPEKQAGWCQGRRPWERDQGGTRLKRTQLGPRWASETLGHLLPKRCLLSGNPLQKPQEIREENSMQSKTSLFIEMILLHWQSWGAVMQKHALGKKIFFFFLTQHPKKEERKASKKERKHQAHLSFTFWTSDFWAVI